MAHHLTALHQHDSRGKRARCFSACSEAGTGLSGSLQHDGSLVFQFLPVYTPSEEEKNDPHLYADNVQKLMARYV